MFQGLDDIDWSKLEHAYGPATDVPALLRALVKEEEREGAMHALHGNIFHQSTRYPATPHAVPFIVEIVNDASQSRSTREAALTLLTNVVAGWLSPNAGPDNADGGPEHALVDGAPFECDTSLEIRRAIDTAAAKGIVGVRALLDHDAPSLRARAAAFLSLFRTRAKDAEIIHALERCLARDDVPEVRATLAFALGHVLPLVATATPDGDASLRALLAPREHGAVRAMAAIMLARRGVRDEIVSDVLVRALDFGDEVDGVFTSTPVTTEGVAGEAARAIGLLGAGARVLPQLTDKLRKVSGFEAVNLLEAALAAAFPTESAAPIAPIDDASKLSEAQRALLEALVQNDEGFWGVGNALNVLMERGLPSMREEMAQLLGVPFTHDAAREEVRHAEMMLHSFHDAERALEHLERALEANPQLGRAHLLKGFALLETDDVDGALASFRTSIALVEGEEQMLARKNTAVLLGDLGRREEALPFLEQNVAAQPGSSVAWYDLGLCLVKAGEHSRCIDAITRCLAIQPDVANAHYTIACAYALRAKTSRASDGDVERAIQSIRAAVELDAELMDAIRDDDDFATIRNDARFVALVGGRA